MGEWDFGLVGGDHGIMKMFGSVSDYAAEDCILRRDPCEINRCGCDLLRFISVALGAPQPPQPITHLNIAGWKPLNRPAQRIMIASTSDSIGFCQLAQLVQFIRPAKLYDRTRVRSERPASRPARRPSPVDRACASSSLAGCINFADKRFHRTVEYVCHP